MRARLLIAALAVLVPASAHSQIVTGNDLIRHCGNDDPGFASGFCLGYIRATSDTAEDSVCYPEGVTNGQMRQVVVKFLNENPEYSHFYALALVEAALMKAFPCE